MRKLDNIGRAYVTLLFLWVALFLTGSMLDRSFKNVSLNMFVKPKTRFAFANIYIFLKFSMEFDALAHKPFTFKILSSIASYHIVPKNLMISRLFHRFVLYFINFSRP